jgi:tetratricopeptide (TPR) repeat protein
MRHHRPILAVATLLLAVAPAARAADANAGAEASYAACMELARRAPDDALVRAEGLMKAGFAAPARHCLGTALLTLGRAAQAAKVFLELARGFKDVAPSERAEAFGQAGRAWLEAGDAARAEAAYGEALALAPNDVLRLIDRAIARGALKRDFAALDDLNQALELAPDSIDARILRAAANRRAGAPDLAEEDIKAALAQDPESPAAWLERGLLAQSRQRTAEARAAFKKAATLDPGGPSGITARAALARLDGVKRSRP